MDIYVLMFNVDTDNQGLHTLRIGDQDWVLMFEDEDDATRYALLLEAQDFPAPTVEAIPQAEIEEFCQGAGFGCQLVPRGFVPEDDADRLLLAPPENNLPETTWQQDGSPSHADKPTPPDSAILDGEPSIPESELEKIRRRLEGLL